LESAQGTSDRLLYAHTDTLTIPPMRVRLMDTTPRIISTMEFSLAWVRGFTPDGLAADSTDAIGIEMAGSAADSVAMTEGSVAGAISEAVQTSVAEATSAEMAERASEAEAASEATADPAEAVDSAAEINHEAVADHMAEANRAVTAVTAATGNSTQMFLSGTAGSIRCHPFSICKPRSPQDRGATKPIAYRGEWGLGWS
jgi:hypothetical protein